MEDLFNEDLVEEVEEEETAAPYDEKKVKSYSAETTANYLRSLRNCNRVMYVIIFGFIVAITLIAIGIMTVGMEKTFTSAVAKSAMWIAIVCFIVAIPAGIFMYSIHHEMAQINGNFARAWGADKKILISGAVSALADTFLDDRLGSVVSGAADVYQTYQTFKRIQYANAGIVEELLKDNVENPKTGHSIFIANVLSLVFSFVIIVVAAFILAISVSTHPNDDIATVPSTGIGVAFLLINLVFGGAMLTIYIQNRYYTYAINLLERKY
ncbi:MAG: hypothetical protein K6A63_03825 [Acholeplasmatales bacterium]|nr:hypothetical protein [Acholeplasmatales bacterium]